MNFYVDDYKMLWHFDSSMMKDRESSRKQVSDIKRSSFFVKYKELNIIDYTGNNITIVCNVCNSNYEINRSLLYFRFGENLNPCTTCNPVNELRSIKENEICLFLDIFFS